MYEVMWFYREEEDVELEDEIRNTSEDEEKLYERQRTRS